MLILDRFEGNFAVCEDENREMRRVPRAELPDSAREGDCFVRENGQWRRDAEETERRRRANVRRFRFLMRKK